MIRQKNNKLTNTIRIVYLFGARHPSLGPRECAERGVLGVDGDCPNLKEEYRVGGGGGGGSAITEEESVYIHMCVGALDK